VKEETGVGVREGGDSSAKQTEVMTGMAVYGARTTKEPAYNKAGMQQTMLEHPCSA